MAGQYVSTLSVTLVLVSAGQFDMCWLIYPFALCVCQTGKVIANT